MKNANNQFVVEDFSFQPKELNFEKYRNMLPFLNNREAHREETKRLLALFKADALEACGIADHPRANQAFSLAWEYGHAEGYHDVFYYLQDIANLIRGLK